MDNQKGLAPILIILLIAFLVGGYLIYQKQKPTVIPQQITQSTLVPTSVSESPTSTDIANWKKYTNSKYKFSFNYPDSWIVGEDSGKQSRGVPLVFLRPSSLQTQNNSYGEVSIWVYNDIKTIEQYAAKLCDSPNVCVSSDNIKKFKVANLDVYNIRNIPGPLPSEEVVFKEEDLLIVFHFNYQGESYNSYSNKESKQVFNQILSTFKFNQ